MGFESTLECARWQARSARSHRSKLVFLRRGETKERRFQQRATVASVLITLLLFVACSDSPTQPTRLAEATPSAESASGPSLTGADVTATAGTSHPLLPPTPDHSSSTPPPPGPSNPRTRFGPGQHRVGRDIRPGRYFSDPRRGCFWERLSGFGGTISDTIANEFIGFDAGQWIVDIKASDVGFSTDDDCGGPDVFVGAVWGHGFDGGTVFQHEKVTLTFATFPAPCNLKIWMAIKAANNGNRLQQKTVRNNGTGMVMLTANFNGQLVYTVQQRDPNISCAVATDLKITPAAG